MSIIALTEKAKEKSRDNIEYSKHNLSPNLRHHSVIYYVRRDTLYRATIFEILTHQRLTWMQLTLCTLSLVCSMCSFLYATFDHHLLRQPPTVTNQPLNIYIYMSTIQNQKKKKNHETNFVQKYSTIWIRISFIGLFDWPTKKKKKKTMKNIHLRLSLSLLFGRIDAALTLLVTSVLLLTSTLTIGKTNMVTMAAMVTRRSGPNTTPPTIAYGELFSIESAHRSRSSRIRVLAETVSRDFDPWIVRNSKFFRFVLRLCSNEISKLHVVNRCGYWEWNIAILVIGRI